MAVIGKRGIFIIKEVSANYTALQTDEVIIGDSGSDDITITLPTAVGIRGRIITIKKEAGTDNDLTVNTTSSQTIDGDTSVILEGEDGAILRVVSDGSNWHILQAVEL
jgi:hypothetical protein